MTTDTLLAVVYLSAFQLCAAPSIVRILRRKSSDDLSVWREWLLLFGCSVQLVVMLRTGAAIQIIVSPIATMLSVSVLLLVIRRYRTQSNNYSGFGNIERGRFSEQQD